MTNTNMNEEWLREPVDDDQEAAPEAGTTVLEKADNADNEGESIKEGVKAADRLGSLIDALETSQIAPAKAVVLRSILKNVRSSIDNAIVLLDAKHGSKAPEHAARIDQQPPESIEHSTEDAEQVIEGVFNGLAMVGDDGKEYNVPPNYASKSKLVEGDLLKLYINERGNFIYKQIGPIERQRLVGSVSYDQETSQYTVLAAGRSWKILKASITFFKAEIGDEAVVLVPKNAPSRWAAVENIIKKDVSRQSSAVIDPGTDH